MAASTACAMPSMPRGGTAQGTCHVYVPHDMSDNHPVVDSGVHYCVGQALGRARVAARCATPVVSRPFSIEPGPGR